MNQFRDQPSIYSQIVDAIDVKLMNAATEAELSHRGSGLNCLMDELLARNVIAPPPRCAMRDPQGGSKTWRTRARTGSLGPIFLRKIRGNIFFGTRLHRNESERAKR